MVSSANKRNRGTGTGSLDNPNEPAMFDRGKAQAAVDSSGKPTKAAMAAQTPVSTSPGSVPGASTLHFADGGTQAKYVDPKGTKGIYSLGVPQAAARQVLAQVMQPQPQRWAEGWGGEGGYGGMSDRGGGWGPGNNGGNSRGSYGNPGRGTAGSPTGYGGSQRGWGW